MSKEAWFRYFERVQAEHPDLHPCDAAELALETMVADRCDKADMLRKADKEGGNG